MERSALRSSRSTARRRACCRTRRPRLERWSLGFNVRRDGEILRRAAAIVSTSRWTERDVRRLYPDCRTPIHVHAPIRSISTRSIAAWIDERRSAAPGAAPQCLFIGGDFPRKGGYDLLEAWDARRISPAAPT